MISLYVYTVTENLIYMYGIKIIVIVFVAMVQMVVTVSVFSIGFMADAAIAIVGLTSMEVVPNTMTGGAHGLACALGQGK